MSDIPDFVWLAGDDDGGVVVVCGRCPLDGKLGLAYHCGPGESHANGLPHFPRTDLAGFLRFIHQHANTHRDWVASPDDPNWGPLRKALPLDGCGDWMWMSRSVDGDRVIEAYKHAGTRGYLHLDQDGQAWTFELAAEGCLSPFICDIDHEHTDNTYTARRVPLDEALKWAGL